MEKSSLYAFIKKVRGTIDNIYHTPTKSKKAYKPPIEENKEIKEIMENFSE